MYRASVETPANGSAAPATSHSVDTTPSPAGDAVPSEERQAELQAASRHLQAGLEGKLLTRGGGRRASSHRRARGQSLGIPVSEHPENLVAGKELASGLLPRGPAGKSLLGDLVDVEILERTEEPPPGRFTGGYANGGDLGFMREAQQLVDQGAITRHTFVISSTGHDIPVLAQLASNTSLSIDGTVNLDSKGLRTGSDNRVKNQAQTWGQEISAHLKATDAGASGALFLGLEAHRRNPVEAAALPSIERLRSHGIDSIVYLLENSPTREYDPMNVGKPEVRAYLAQAAAAGLRVEARGLDYRVDQPRNGRVPLSFRPGPGGFQP